MRKWFNDEKQRLTGLEDEQFKQKLDELRQNIYKKASLLTQLQPPSFFQSMDPLADVVSSVPTIKQPSFVQSKSSQTGDIINDSLKAHKEWRSSLESTGAIQSEQEKRSEVRKCGTSAVLVCL